MEWVRIEQHFHSYLAITFGKSFSTKWKIIVVEGDLKKLHVVGEQYKMWDQQSKGPMSHGTIFMLDPFGTVYLGFI